VKTLAGRYLKNLLIAIDQLGNALWAGSPDETISSRIGKLRRMERSGKPMRWGPRVLGKLLNKIDPGHCEDAIEEDEGAEALADKERKG
jgi:hypothetical protein